MWSKLSLLMQVTTSPGDRTSASPHTGGWSESLWFPGNFADVADAANTLGLKRASLLPTQASVVGYRVATYTAVGNKLIPGGTSTGKMQIPGGSGLDTDLPQVGLEMSGASQDGPNTNRLVLRCIPDGMMVNGEFQPSNSYLGRLSRYVQQVCVGEGYGFIGRDKTVAAQRVFSIGANVVKLQGSIGAVIGEDFMRFNRVRDVNGDIVDKVVLITAFAAPGTYTVSGLDGITANDNGTARVDKLKFFDLSTLNFSRAVVKKIGRPFESYRGRASKRKA